ncbi:MAG: DUF1127 domain-containing protein [Ideonella sp.]|nr:DUF1127 domain-containing protein [Ideonella sp.]MCC7459640.1 DUF1127 domain-containing protein [Nitrospira sp.]
MNRLHQHAPRTPAGAAPASHWFARGWEAVSTWRDRSRGRDLLGELDERMLKDIGLSHADAIVEAGKSFWQR